MANSEEIISRLTHELENAQTENIQASDIYLGPSLRVFSFLNDLF